MGDPKHLQMLIEELSYLTHNLANDIAKPLNTADDFTRLAMDTDQLSRTLLLAADIRRNISSQLD
jgi:hypothetical protein